MSIQRLDVGPRMSQAVVHGDTVYLAGQVPTDRNVGAKEQTQQVLAKIDQLLAAAGSYRSKLLSATIWLKSMDDFAAMNEVWDAWVSPGNTPARACVQAEMARPDILVEIAVIAAR